MDPAIVPAAAPVVVTFADGLGQRHQITDRSRNEPVELLCLRGELTSVPSFEFALRERVSHLATFHHACYAHVRGVERLKNSSSTLVVVSDVTAGVRLSDVLAFADRTQVTLDIDAALCLLRQIVPAVAMLHENAPGVSHGAIAVERIIVTPGARIVMVEHVLGSAIGELHLSRERYWKELRVALPGTTSPPVFSHRSDVTQIGVVALSLILLFTILRGRALHLHGAEHRAIAAAEERRLASTWTGAARPSRFSPRCGTNFAALALPVTFIADRVLPMAPAFWSPVVVLVLSLALTMELWRLVQKSSGRFWQAFLKPGLALQRLTTREPTLDETQVALRAVAAVLRHDLG